jgi:hypothetical protein
MNQQATEVTGLTLTTDTGAAESQATGNACEDTNEGGSSSGDDEPAPDNAHLWKEASPCTPCQRTRERGMAQTRRWTSETSLPRKRRRQRPSWMLPTMIRKDSR